jgi:hypothetical protein
VLSSFSAFAAPSTAVTAAAPASRSASTSAPAITGPALLAHHTFATHTRIHTLCQIMASATTTASTASSVAAVTKGWPPLPSVPSSAAVSPSAPSVFAPGSGSAAASSVLFDVPLPSAQCQYSAQALALQRTQQFVVPTFWAANPSMHHPTSIHSCLFSTYGSLLYCADDAKSVVPAAAATAQGTSSSPAPAPGAETQCLSVVDWRRYAVRHIPIAAEGEELGGEGLLGPATTTTSGPPITFDNLRLRQLQPASAARMFAPRSSEKYETNHSEENLREAMID